MTIKRRLSEIGGRNWYNTSPIGLTCNSDSDVLACALRCVARDIETPIVFLFLSPRNATRSRNGNTALRSVEVPSRPMQIQNVNVISMCKS